MEHQASRSPRRGSWLVGLMLVPLGWGDSSSSRSAAAAVPPPSTGNARITEGYGRLPLSFEANRGQADPRVDFLARGCGYTLFLTSRDAALALRAPAQRASGRFETPPPGTGMMVRMTLAGARSPAHVAGRDELPGKANYFLGNDPKKWHANVPTYAKVHYQDVYPGIDLSYHGRQGQLEYDFIVRSGADPETIRLDFEGADTLEVDGQGELVLHTALGDIRQGKPTVYQEVNGVRKEIAGAYVIRNKHDVGFEVAAYDSTWPLVIDPVLFYSTYLGGSGIDLGFGIAVDGAGNAYVSGVTTSSDFPITPGAFQTTFGAGPEDCFVTKLNPTGSGLSYSTYLGGGGPNRCQGIAVDAAGNAYVTGQTSSTNFPTTPGALQTTFGGVQDGFVTKLNATGSGLLYSTYLGGNGDDVATAIALDTANEAYVAGFTNSTNFPTTAGAFQSAFAGGLNDLFVARINSTGSGLVYSTYLGGSGTEETFNIAVDAAGSAYVAAVTNSTNFPTTPGAFQTTFGGGTFDDTVTKLNPIGSTLVYSTYVGGSADEDIGAGIAVDAAGNAYVAGQTNSTNFPTTPGAFQTTFGGGAFDAFVTKVNPLGAGLVYSTYLGGNGQDQAFGIAVDALDDAFVAGQTDSTNFPTANPMQASLGGVRDIFVTELNPTGASLVFSTYLGGSGDEQGPRIALDTLPNPNAYVTGDTGSTNFPTTAGAFQTTLGGGLDAFVAKIANIVLPPPPTVGKVTGGGSVNVANGIGTFGFIVQRQQADESIHGDLQYVNHASKTNVHSVLFTTFVITGNVATFGGTCTRNSLPCTFSVDVTDNGEPGTTDSFTITVDAGPPEGGTLRSGNIQIHQ